MSLILAVEPDRRQAKLLSALIREHVDAELVVADSGSAALAALADRIPDLVLTPPLLPPKDEAVLTGWLRDLGDAAAHVQTLAIPILAEMKKGKESSSIFGRGRDQSAAGPGCDPGVFADQVRVYLDRAGVERLDRGVERVERSVPLVSPEPTDIPDEPVDLTAAIDVAAEDDATDIDDIDDAMTFEDLVFEPTPAREPAVPPLSVPVAEPPLTMKSPTPFARPEKRVDQSTLRSWEAELGLDGAAATAPPLWTMNNDGSVDPEALASRGEPMGTFDPDDPRYAPLFQRLDQLAAMHA